MNFDSKIKDNNDFSYYIMHNYGYEIFNDSTNVNIDQNNNDTKRKEDNVNEYK